ncbi:MAG: MBL fold metallo-hydrolase [Deferribacteraceae bacterium]|jgi:glyoxylase-like metal-dependent hydrolase (beta-lactamase superfamily II)|nr:MBL fold metallo-hydrolase [Deferribacteraceae bacterium]
MNIRYTPLGALEANCIFLTNPDSPDNELILVDPGDEPDKIIKIIDKNSFKLIKILLTHGHFDHVGAAESLQSRYSVPVCIHPSDYLLVDAAAEYSAAFGGYPTKKIGEKTPLLDGEAIDFAGSSIKVIHTPGHTSGSLSFYIEANKIVLTGDTLFAGGVGRTDLVGAVPDSLFPSIKEKLYCLPEDTEVIAGHGEMTTIGEEKRSNRFVRG